MNGAFSANRYILNVYFVGDLVMGCDSPAVGIDCYLIPLAGMWVNRGKI